MARNVSKILDPQIVAFNGGLLSFAYNCLSDAFLKRESDLSDTKIAFTITFFAKTVLTKDKN